METNTEYSGLTACRECDWLHAVKPVPEGGRAYCVRCGALLYKNIPDSIEKALALNLGAFLLFILANVFPFISIKLSGRVEENIFISGALALYRSGMGELGLLVFLTSFLFPITNICGMLYILIPLRLGFHPFKTGSVYRLIRALMPWSLVAVFLLAALIAIVKLQDLASVIPGISLYSFAGLMFLSAAAHANLDHSMIWPPVKSPAAGNIQGGTAAGLNLIRCHSCSLLVSTVFTSDKHGRIRCPRCGAPLHRRKVNSLARTWALIFTAALLYIPANVYPVMTVTRFGSRDPNTIFSGVVYLIEEDMWILAMIIFLASIVIPVMKLAILSFLTITVKKKSGWRLRDRTILFRITEGVGAWSMVDIYVVAVLAGLVNLGSMATIKPGIGASFFGAVVVITMFAAQSFDPRLIWDNAERSS